MNMEKLEETLDTIELLESHLLILPVYTEEEELKALEHEKNMILDTKLYPYVRKTDRGIVLKIDDRVTEFIPGDFIAFPMNAVSRIKLENEEYYTVRESECLGKIKSRVFDGVKNW